MRHVVLAIVTTVVLAGAALPGASAWFSLPYGHFGPFGDNEVELISTKDDPPKLRMESPGPGRWMGALSFGRSAKEKVLMGGKLSEDGARGEFGIWLYDDARPGSEDNKMGDPVLYVTPGGVLVNGQALGSGGGSSRMVSSNGRFWFQPVQDDGNFVLYDADDPTRPVAIFDLWSLLARLDRVDAELRALEGRR